MGQLTGIWSKFGPSLCLYVSGYENTLAYRILSLDNSIPGTRFPGEKAAYSTSAKKF